jgi:hypothetical protein
MKPADDFTALGHVAKVDFHHPYVPYDVQLQFMRTAYDVLSCGEGQVGILESPTGTVCTSSSDHLQSVPARFCLPAGLLLLSRVVPSLQRPYYARPGVRTTDGT